MYEENIVINRAKIVKKKNYFLSESSFFPSVHRVLQIIHKFITKHC